MALVLFYTNFTFSLLIDYELNEVRYYCEPHCSAGADSSPAPEPWESYRNLGSKLYSKASFLPL